MQLYHSFTNQFHFIVFLGLFSLLLVSCNKKTEEVAPIEIPERLEISPASQSVMIGETVTFTTAFFDNMGNPVASPSDITWESSNLSVASINQDGVASGLSAGQTTIKATYQSVEATALLTVVTSNDEVATVTITPSVSEITLTEMATLGISVKNNLGEEITGKTATWNSGNIELVTVENGEVTAENYGTANVTATVDGIQSSPATIQVIRRGTFTNRGSGTAKLRIENDVLQVVLADDFSTSSSPPDLRIYLSQNNDNVNDAVELANLDSSSGRQIVNVSSEISITDYRYVMIWCKQFGGVYGVADMGE
ncbi:DM13 domain-containing protein [Bernardetia sp.]|uniref:DM13 domain-containing protein n=1 Tax=Bernardetia sp. TaxID=1937974 RepID=UPI0025C1DA15|nr:DM13 domain-containing protein [Bernardetia sp.]